MTNKPGRPSLPPAERRQRINLKLPPEMVEWLRGMGITATIEAMVADRMWEEAEWKKSPSKTQ